MNKKSRFLSLKVKVILLLIVAFGVAWLSYVGIQQAGYSIINGQYMSAAASSARMKSYQSSLQNFVDRNEITSEDFDGLKDWNDDNDVYLMVYNTNNELLFESNWWDDNTAAGISYSTDEETAALDSSTEDPALLEETLAAEDVTPVEPMSGMENLFPIRFANGDAMVSLIDYSDLTMFYLADNVALVLAVLFFAGCVIWFNYGTTKKILRLAAEVREVENGNLEKVITIQGHDELAVLSNDINNMRQSVVMRWQKEQEAWQANCELITAMSHDIRTPLTALLGYLDIIEGEKYQSREQFDRYVHSSKQKALQLKDLSDKLFQYFVVFGNENKPLECVTYDAAQLISQVLGEQMLYLQGAGFEVELEPLEESCNVKLEICMIRRVFDNGLSNIKKYADPSEPVMISAQRENGQVIIRMTNAVKQETIGVESTKIGLKSCEKMMAQMDGGFDYEDNGSHFTVLIRLQEVAEEAEETV